MRIEHAKKENQTQQEEILKNKNTWNANIITKHEASCSSHYAWNDDDRRYLRLELHSSGRRGRESSGRHDYQKLLNTTQEKIRIPLAIYLLLLKSIV